MAIAITNQGRSRCKQTTANENNLIKNYDGNVMVCRLPAQQKGWSKNVTCKNNLR
jgi:hypothetical protein